MLVVEQPGLLTTLQGRPRLGLRHMGVPHAGPADPLSLALANRLVGNPLFAAAIEINFGGFAAYAEEACQIALTGAEAALALSGQPTPFHTTLTLRAGDRVALSAPASGVRTYLAIAGGFAARSDLGSPSTYLAAGLGGLEGRALKTGDRLISETPPGPLRDLQTPTRFRPILSTSHALRASTSAETGLLGPEDQHVLFETRFTVSRQITRMGLSLEGRKLQVSEAASMKSVAVYPGTVQCPPEGKPIILGVDAQTTGGYPRIAQIARADRHILGQIRPQDQVQLLRRDPTDLADVLIQKTALYQDWLPGFAF